MKIFGFNLVKKNDEISKEEFFEDIISSTSNYTLNANDFKVNTEKENSFLKVIYDSVSSLKTNVSDNINSTKETTGKAINYSINYISETSNYIASTSKENFVTIKDKIGENYERFEIKNNFYLLIDFISIPIIIIALKKLSIAIPIPQVKLAIIVLIGLLLIFEEHKKNTDEKILTTNQINSKTNFEVSEFLKNIELESIIKTLHPYENQIPYGKQVFFIVKLFTK